eukprot:TRINITY_DN338_c0_g2_i1.p1 TRINITY_DN338_c0_g2~~TRINITY_DN338_c0_g2_i1.p1  ORF type:complete len:463 (+),score=62.08 TRINITY_DN338_c0_g2_i1:61-1449(+)
MKLQIVFAILFAFALYSECQYIDGSYIIQLKDGSTEAHIEEVIQKIEEYTKSPREDMEITSSSVVLPFVFGKFDKETAEMVSGIESVKLVEQDQVVTIAMPYKNPEDFSIDDEYEDSDDTDSDESDYSDSDESDYSDSDESDSYDSQELEEMDEYNSTLRKPRKFKEKKRYNLDIIDNEQCINGNLIPRSYGKGVHIYILDTGIKYNHRDFRKLKGRGKRAKYGGFDIEPENKGQDQNGHGTHCAGIAGGRYSGVAKKSKLYSIRVLNSDGKGSLSDLMKGMEHAYKRHLSKVGKKKFKGSVISMSLGGEYSETQNNLVNEIVKWGVTIVTASGNDGKDACLNSPGSAGLNINVGAHWYKADGSTKCTKPMYARSNYGKCVSIVAPGVDVLSASIEGKKKYTKLTGTSMACPHVSGVAALMLQKKSLSPAQIKQNILKNSLDDLSDEKDGNHRLFLSADLWK